MGYDMPTPASVLRMTERTHGVSASPLLLILARLADSAIEWERKHIMYVDAVNARGEDVMSNGSVREAFTYRMAFDSALRSAVSATWPTASNAKLDEVCAHLKELSGANMYLPGWSDYVAKRDAVKP